MPNTMVEIELMYRVFERKPMRAFEFVEMRDADLADVLALIGRAMNPEESEYAKHTFDFHFSCQSAKSDVPIDSKRAFYLARHEATIKGVIGLHHYRWGPLDNVWLSWFAVEPELQGQGIGQWMMAKIEQLSRHKGYKKLFIETYRHDIFSRAIEFYQKQGFLQVGQIGDYLIDGSDMLVFAKSLN